MDNMRKLTRFTCRSTTSRTRRRTKCSCAWTTWTTSRTCTSQTRRACPSLCPWRTFCTTAPRAPAAKHSSGTFLSLLLKGISKSDTCNANRTQHWPIPITANRLPPSNLALCLFFSHADYLHVLCRHVHKSPLCLALPTSASFLPCFQCPSFRVASSRTFNMHFSLWCTQRPVGIRVPCLKVVGVACGEMVFCIDWLQLVGIHVPCYGLQAVLWPAPRTKLRSKSPKSQFFPQEKLNTMSKKSSQWRRNHLLSNLYITYLSISIKTECSTFPCGLFRHPLQQHMKLHPPRARRTN